MGTHEPDDGTVLGVDLGTSGLKVVLVRPDGTLAAESEAAYDVEHPRPGWSQADPATWIAALERALADLADRARRAGADPVVRAVGIAGQMHAAALVDEAGAAVGPAVLWTDQRAADQLPAWRALPEPVRAPLANPLVAGMTGPVLGWFTEHEPAALARAAAVLLPKDVVRAWLVDHPALARATTDRSDAAGTLLWDVTTDGWAREVVDRLGLPGHLLPGVAPSDAVAGTTARLRRWFPASGAQVPVVVGGGDTPVARLAVGSPALQVNLGTGAQVIAALARPREATDPVVHTYADTGSGADAGWYSMVAVQNAGLALDWARRVLGLAWDEVFDLAGKVPDGARGVTFLPYLTGERGGIAGPAARGAWTGLGQDTGRAELVRAALEGMAFSVRAAVGLLPGERPVAGGPGDAADGDVVTVTGGGTRHPLVRRLLADALGRPVRRVELRSATAVGAAMLAARGTSSGVEALVPQVETADVVTPGAGELDPAYARWTAATRALDRPG